MKQSNKKHFISSNNSLFANREVTMNYLLIITVLATVIAMEQAAPVSSSNVTPASSDTATTTTAPTANIPALKVTAMSEIIAVQQEIQLLEKATVRKTLSILIK